MNTAPHYYKLYSRISYIWGNHRGQHIQSAMDKLHSRKIIFIVIISSLTGKYFSFIHNSSKFYWKFHKHSLTNHIRVGMVVSTWFHENLSWSAAWCSRASQIHTSMPLHLLLPKPFQKFLKYIVRMSQSNDPRFSMTISCFVFVFAIVTNYLV